MGTLYGVDGDLLERQYRNHLSNYLHWDQLAHAENWLLFEKNIGAYVCIDEVALSRGELYTVLVNKRLTVVKAVLLVSLKVRMFARLPLSCLNFRVVAATRCVR